MRRGISILEVMFAILVTSIGLLGALAVFPVASSMARKGQMSDMAAIAGKSAVHDFDARGMREPRRWIAWNATTNSWGNYSPVFGESYCIDPRGVAANSGTPLANQFFPYGATAAQPRMRRLTLDAMTIIFGPDNTSPYAAFDDYIAPSGIPMSKPQADAIFNFADDLTGNRPEDRSLPVDSSFVEVDNDNNATTAKTKIVRSTDGHYSWMATLTPKLEVYAPPALIQSQEYVLSIVVFHDRPADLTAGDPFHERIVTADFADAGGSGFAGGEVYLSWTAAQSTANDTVAKDTLKVRSGDWILLCSGVPHALGGVHPIFAWFRISEADSEPEYHAAEGHYAIAASLTGPDWDAASSQQANAVLMTGVIGVYEKTIRLDQTPWQ